MRKAGVEGTKEARARYIGRENLGSYFLDFHDGVKEARKTRVTFASTYFAVRCYAYRTFIRDARDEVDARANFIAILPIFAVTARARDRLRIQLYSIALDVVIRFNSTSRYYVVKQKERGETKRKARRGRKRSTDGEKRRNFRASNYRF